MKPPIVLPTSALCWSAWIAAALLTLIVADGWWVSASVLVAVAITWHFLGRERPGIGLAVAGVSSAVLSVWVVLAVVLHREAMGGRVLWVLPSWRPASGGAFGGAVTTGQLEHALAQGVRGVAILAVLGLAYRVVAAEGWVRLSVMVAGRGAFVLAPTLCLGEAVVEHHRDRMALRASGLHRAVAPGARLGDVWDRAVDRARHLVAVAPGVAEPATRSSGRAVIATAVGAAVVILAMRREAFAGPEIVALALLAAIALSAGLVVRGADRLRSSDAVALAAAVVMLVVRYGAPGLADAAVAGCVLLLPALLILGRERR